MDRLVESKEFGTIYDRATESQRTALNKVVDDPNATTIDIREWIAEVNKRPLELYSYRRLRDMARLANVFNYSRLTKDELIDELERADARLMEKRPKPD